jgi:hypothetical protein
VTSCGRRTHISTTGPGCGALETEVEVAVFVAGAALVVECIGAGVGGAGGGKGACEFPEQFGRWMKRASWGLNVVVGVVMRKRMR